MTVTRDISDIPAPPREVRLRAEARSRVWLSRAFTIPFIASAVFFFVKLFEEPITREFGSDAVGRVVSVRPSLRSNPGERMDVTYSYETIGGYHGIGYTVFDHEIAETPQLGQSLAVRALDMGSLHYSALRDPHSSSRGFICAGLFFTVWGLIIGIVVFGAWFGPFFERRLLRDGLIASGTITEKQDRPSGRSRVWEIKYRFTAASQGEISAKTQVTSQAFERLHVGDTVTVVYAQLNPYRSSLYETSDFQWIARS